MNYTQYKWNNAQHNALKEQWQSIFFRGNQNWLLEVITFIHFSLFDYPIGKIHKSQTYKYLCLHVCCCKRVYFVAFELQKPWLTCSYCHISIISPAPKCIKMWLLRQKTHKVLNLWQHYRVTIGWFGGMTLSIECAHNQVIEGNTTHISLHICIYIWAEYTILISFFFWFCI